MAVETAELQALNEKFSPGETARFVAGANNLPMLALRTPLAEADIYLHGAHVTHYQPAGQQPLLYLSPISHFEQGEPIRGGVPVCFPWFADAVDDPSLPPHGFVRNVPWQPTDLRRLGDGRFRFTLTFEHTPREQHPFPHPFRLTYTVIVGASLHLELRIENPAEGPLPCEVALHTYLAVRDVRRVQLLGLEGAEYLDKTDAHRRKAQPAAPVVFTAETDRIYLDTQADCRLLDVPGGRHVLIEKTGSDTTVVWNPWVSKAHRLTDLADDDWPRMVCVETANARDNALRIPGGQSHTMTTTITSQLIE